MPPPISLAGKVLDGSRIQLGSMIGSGGYGAVYHAVNLDTGAQYAVKVIQKRDNPNYHRELHLHSVVSNHPNIVTLHQVLESRSSIYIVLDYLAGGDLFDAVTGNTVYAGNDELIKSVFLQLLDAVEYCHSSGIYHRDLKPENILCNKDATQLFLVDFGLATENHISQSMGCGSLQYMSPECIGIDIGNTEYNTASSDIWALGIVLVNLIVGRNPWEFATMNNACYRSFVKDAKSLRKAFPISAAALDIFARIFTRDPGVRISLSELRQVVMEADTFYMSSSEIAMSSRRIQEAAVSYGPLSKPGRLHRPYFFEDLGPGFSSGGSSEPDSDGPITPDNEGSILCLEDLGIDDLDLEEIIIHPGAMVEKTPRQHLIPENLSALLRRLVC